MGIISRFKDIMSANINALLDKAEDPEKMIDQYLRDMESDLGKVKAETAAVMAEETRCKRQLDECTAEMNKYQQYQSRHASTYRCLISAQLHSFSYSKQNKYRLKTPTILHSLQ